MVVVADQLMYTGIQTAPVGAEDYIEKLQSFASRYVMSQPTWLSASALFSTKPRQFMQLADILSKPLFVTRKCEKLQQVFTMALILCQSSPPAFVKEGGTLTSHGMQYTQGQFIYNQA